MASTHCTLTHIPNTRCGTCGGRMMTFRTPSSPSTLRDPGIKLRSDRGLQPAEPSRQPNTKNRYVFDDF